MDSKVPAHPAVAAPALADPGLADPALAGPPAPAAAVPERLAPTTAAPPEPLPDKAAPDRPAPDTATSEAAVSDAALSAPVVSDAALSAPVVSDAALSAAAVSDAALSDAAASDAVVSGAVVSGTAALDTAASDAALPGKAEPGSAAPGQAQPGRAASGKAQLGRAEPGKAQPDKGQPDRAAPDRAVSDEVVSDEEVRDPGAAGQGRESRLLPGLSPAHRIAADLDGYLGDPMDDEAGPFSYKAIVEAEERDELPPGAVDAVRAWGFPKYLVPCPLGGRLSTLEELFFVTRGISRRSVTVAVMYGSGLLAVNPVWLWGSAWQRKTVADGVLRGDLACFGVSEADHGSDVMASESEADLQGDELVLTGVKWPVGNATRGRFVTTYAKTGPRDFSLILVDKRELDPAAWSTLPPVRTVGLRGHDLSGVAFSGARVPADRVIGRRGSGLVQTLKTLQITRTAIAALSVGTIDAVVRIGMEYSRQRTLYGSDIYKIPVIRDHLLKAHLDLLIAECVAIPVTRCLTVAPGRLSLWSSIAKYFVPVLGEEVVASIGTVLAARGYLREGVAHGVFQKLQRDHAIASIFEGTTHVNLANVAGQLPYLVDPPEETGGEDELLAELFCWTRTPPAWEPDGRRLQLTNEGRDEVGQRFEQIAEAVLEAANAHAAPGVAAELKDLMSSIGGLRAKVEQGIRAAEGDTSSVAALARAKRYSELHAMVSCMLTWLHNRHAFGGPFADGQWLALCLQRLLQRALPDAVLSEEFLPPLEDAMFRSFDERRWFSLLSLAEDEQTQQPRPKVAGSHA